MRDRRIRLAPRRRRADHQHYDANDRQAAASRPVSSQGRTEERDWWRSARQYPTRSPGVHLGLRQPFSPPPSTQPRLHRPRRRESRRALRSRVSPEFHGSPARHCEYSSQPPRQNVVTSSFRRVSRRRNRSRLMPGAGSPARYRGPTCSSQARDWRCGGRLRTP